MKRTLTIVVALAFTLTLAGCQQTKADVRRDAEFAKACTDSGGSVYYDGLNSIACDFTTTTGGTR